MLFNRKSTRAGGYYQFHMFSLPQSGGVSTVLIVSETVLPSSKLLVQAKIDQRNKEERQPMGCSSLPKVDVPSLPVTLLFGKNE